GLVGVRGGSRVGVAVRCARLERREQRRLVLLRQVLVSGGEEALGVVAHLVDEAARFCVGGALGHHGGDELVVRRPAAVVVVVVAAGGERDRQHGGARQGERSWDSSGHPLLLVPDPIGDRVGGTITYRCIRMDNRRPRGRPRNEQLTEDVVTAARELLATQGFEALTL